MLVDDEYYQSQPDDDGELLYWMWCEEQREPTDGDDDSQDPIGFNDPPPF